MNPILRYILLLSSRRAPTITSIDIAIGPAAGGTVIVATGTGFVAGAQVVIGTRACTGENVTAPTSCTFTSGEIPAGASGPLDVVVTNPDGQSATLAGGFTYAPEIVSLDVTVGTARGGVAVVATCRGLVASPTGTVGGVAVTGSTRVSAVEWHFTTPAATVAHFSTATPGVVDVVVTNTDGQSHTLSAGYRHRQQAGVVLDGVNELLRNLSVAPWPNGACTLVARVWRTSDAAKRAWAAGSAAGESISLAGNTTGRGSTSVSTGGVSKYSGSTANNTADVNNWILIALTRNAAGVHVIQAAENGGVMSVAAGSAAYNGVPAFTGLYAGGDGTAFSAITLAGCAVYLSDLSVVDGLGTSPLARMLTNQQYWPASPYCAAILPGISGTIADGFPDHGTTGGMAVTAVAMEAGDLVDDGGAGTAYPVAA